MTTIKIGGVPEHFNLPWHLAIEDDAFAKANIELQWQDVPEGTGKMCQALTRWRSGCRLYFDRWYYKGHHRWQSFKDFASLRRIPIIWGVHAPASLIAEDTAQLIDPKIAISRYGSGSHLMSFLLAKRHDWDPETLRFELVNTLDGAVKSLSSDQAQLFLWERYMTQPYVDQGIFKRLETIATPWPSFVIAATDQCIQEKEDALVKMLQIINKYSSDFKDIPSIDRTIASHYDLQVGDVQQWLLRTEFSDQQLNATTVAKSK